MCVIVRPADRVRRTRHGLAIFFLFTALCMSGSAVADDWRWEISPYLWAADLGIDVSIRDTQVVDTEITFDELLEGIELAGQVHVEAQKGRHGALLDVFLVQLADEQDVDLPAGLPATAARFDSETTMAIVDLAGLYDPGGEDPGVSFKYGARILQQSLDLDATFDLAAGGSATRHFETDDVLVDALVGIRYELPLTARLRLLLGADVSTGDTEMTWSAGGYLSLALGDSGRYALSGGYRYMDIDFDTEDDVDASQTLSGLGIGLIIAF